LQLGKAEVLRTGNDVAIVALGTMVSPSLEAASILAKDGIAACVINARFLKPLDVDLLKQIKAKHIVTVEESVVDGGFGSAVQEALNLPVHKIGLPCEFIPHSSRQQLLDRYELNSSGIVHTVKGLF